MKYIKENKELLLKYLFIIITNIILYIFCGFYLKNSMYKDIILLLFVVIIDMIIYYYKGKLKFNLYLDLLCNIVIGFILFIFENNMLSYSKILVSLFIANNIIFTRSRLSDKFWIKGLQYILIIVNTIICMFINLMVFYSIFK